MHAHRFATGRLASAALSLLVASNTFAATRCEEPRNRVDRVACAKAKESPEDLRRFVQMTQSIYQLYFWDYMTPEGIDRYYARQQAQPVKVAAADRRPQEAPGVEAAGR